MRHPPPNNPTLRSGRHRQETRLSDSVNEPAVPPSSEGATILQPSASYSITVRVQLPSRPGAFAQVATAIGRTGATLGAIDLVSVGKA
jgi:hypothetical protein